MLELGIDIETFSEEDISRGVYKYAEHASFEITLFAYSVDKGPAKVVDLLSGEKIPQEIFKALFDAAVTKTAFNAAFELACINEYLKRFYSAKPEDPVKLYPEQWQCTQALAAQCGLPLDLERAARVLGTIQQKDTRGKELLRYFAMPCKPSKANGGRTRNLPRHDFAQWLEFKDYAAQDVNTEQAIRAALQWFKVPVMEAALWVLDFKINTRGVLVDMELVNNVIAMDAIVTEELSAELAALTDLSNGKSVKQMKDYILQETGQVITSLNKASIGDVNEAVKGNAKVERALKLREMLSRTSIKKFHAIQKSVCKDGRIRGLFQYYGANRTGRWAGRNVQLQNLKRNDLEDLDLARTLVKAGRLSTLKLLYDDLGLVFSNLIRTAFVASPGKQLVPADFSAIEARVIAWLAGETWRMNVFAGDGKIYETSASKMFNIPLDKITKDLRQRGKVAELALGYAGGVGALTTMGGAKMGLSEQEMERIKVAWRQASPRIVKLWYAMENAAVEAMQTPGIPIPVNGGKIKFLAKGKTLLMVLPSGRQLVYIDIKYDGRRMTYAGLNQETKQWGRIDTYGGKLVENAVQAIARDLLANSLLKMDAAGYDIIMHVHDEIVPEVEVNENTIEEVNNILKQPVAWADGLILNSETFAVDYYQK